MSQPYAEKSMTLKGLMMCLLVISTWGLTASSCTSATSSTDPPASGEAASMSEENPALEATLGRSAELDAVLDESWERYKERFIQADGRVIDREAGDRTVSEGQAYAMLRAVLIDDPETFDQTLQWAENNLAREAAPGVLADSLWAWEWGNDGTGNWGILDANFASDADLDAVTALILAAHRWQRPDYLELAQTKLDDLWDDSTLQVSSPLAEETEPQRYFLPGPLAAFNPQPTVIYLNPSYLAPYAFRLFAQVDPDHDWMALVDSSYAILEESAAVSAAELPGNWVQLNPVTGKYTPIEAPSTLTSHYGFDSYRVWWRLALDAQLFGEPRATQYLQTHLAPLEAFWQGQTAIPAEIGLDGQPLVEYESTAQYGMIYPAIARLNPEFASQILEQKLMPAYQNGIWDNDTAYYTQNLCWFGLFSISLDPDIWMAE
ncbi:MAG: glycosyl hydrolase family 8 [Elainellaceae cyanobacterium]